MRAGIRTGIQMADRVLKTELWYGLSTGLRLARKLGRGTARLDFIVAGLLFATGRWRRSTTVRIDIGTRRTRVILPDLAAFRVLGEIFLFNQYRREPGPDPKSILDLGANIGASALFYRRLYPNAKIVCVEANPAIVEILARNTAPLNVEVIHAAVAPTSGTIDFFISDESWAGTTTPGSEGVRVPVPAVTLDTLVSEHKPELIKIDVEGAEYAILRHSDACRSARIVVGEIHSEREDPQTTSVLEHFAGFDLDVETYGSLTLFRAVRT
jgi:FkbM family methyltransferase